MSSESVKSEKKNYEPRLCYVKKRADFDGYGFNLHAEKGRPGQYIGKVDESSPAESAGLRQGDRIIEVNNHNIGTETHKQVVERIKSVPNETRLLVIDPRADLSDPQQLSHVEKTKESLKGYNNNDSNNSNNNTEKPTVMDEPDSPKPTSPNLEKIFPKMTNQISINNGNHSPTMENGNSSPTSTMPSTNGSVKTLNLHMSAAEFRSQLKSKKKYDPKSDSVDLRKKYDMIQKM